MKNIFDWKNNPDRVFVVVLPLLVMPIGSLFYLAAAKIFFENDWSYMIIFAVFMALLVVALIPVYCLLKALR